MLTDEQIRGSVDISDVKSPEELFKVVYEYLDENKVEGLKDWEQELPDELIVDISTGATCCTHICGIDPFLAYPMVYRLKEVHKHKVTVREVIKSTLTTREREVDHLFGVYELLLEKYKPPKDVISFDDERAEVGMRIGHRDYGRDGVDFDPYVVVPVDFFFLVEGDCEPVEDYELTLKLCELKKKDGKWFATYSVD